jgi:hypothetical protein
MVPNRSLSSRHSPLTQRLTSFRVPPQSTVRTRDIRSNLISVSFPRLSDLSLFFFLSALEPSRVNAVSASARPAMVGRKIWLER